MGFFERLFKIGKAKTNEAITSAEMKNIEALAAQDIADAKKKHIEARNVLAMAMKQKGKLEKEYQSCVQLAETYRAKAKTLHEQGGNDELLRKAFEEIQDLQARASDLKEQLDKAESDCREAEAAVKDLRNNIRSWEQKVRSAKNRIKLQESRASIKKMGASVSGVSAAATIERLEEMADSKEAEADAYSQLSGSDKTLSDEIDEKLAKSGGNDDFESFKNSL